VALGQIDQGPGAIGVRVGEALQSLAAGATLIGGLGPAIAFLPEMATAAFGIPRVATSAVLLWATVFHLFLFGVGFAVFARMWLKPTPLPEHRGQRPMAVLSLGCVAVTAAVAGLSPLVLHAHYFSAVWPGYLCCVWKGLGVVHARFAPARWPVWLTRAHVGAMAVLLAAMIVFIHRHGGTRTPLYGATLGNQIGVAQQIAHCLPGCRIQSRIGNYERFPHSLQVLIEITGTKPSQSPSDPRFFLIDYRDRDPGAISGWIALVPLDPGSGTGPGPKTAW